MSKLNRLMKKRDILYQKLVYYDKLIEELKRERNKSEKLNNINESLPANSYRINSLCVGKVLKINFEEGDIVHKGDTLMIIDSMKMEMSIVSPIDGIIFKIIPTVGCNVKPEELLIIIQ